MVIETFPYGLHPQDVTWVQEQLGKGKVGIVPTDTVYAFCCQSDQKSGYEMICQLKHLDPKEALMSIICKDLSQASAYYTQWDTPTYRILHKNLPGPFTFILNSGHHAPTFLKHKRKTLGLRIPQHRVIKSIMDQMNLPLMVSSVMQEDDINPYFDDADELISRFEKQVAFIILDPEMTQEASTVVDLTGDDVKIIRQSRHMLEG
ncbi:MAG TPA: L-threonylcarbamoyladenylate synthase [Saprospiraceae bacterium]|nr:L-threonylcarbamoyladenylate synthase [Saprospiraceae bacterium]